MSVTYDLISSSTLTSGTTTVTFSSITSAYRDLVLVIGGATNSAQFQTIRFNSDASNSYSLVNMFGNGSSASSTGATTSFFYVNFSSGTTANQENASIIHIFDYSTTDKHKPILCRTEQPNDWTETIAGRWANTSAINRIDISLSGAIFVTGTTFSLYGIVS